MEEPTKSDHSVLSPDKSRRLYRVFDFELVGHDPGRIGRTVFDDVQIWNVEAENSESLAGRVEQLMALAGNKTHQTSMQDSRTTGWESIGNFGASFDSYHIDKAKQTDKERTREQ